MSTDILVKINLILGLGSLLAGIILYLKRKRYFLMQKRYSMDLSKVIKETNRQLFQYISEEEDMVEETIQPQKENFVQINRILRKVDMELSKGDWELAEKMLIEALALGPENEDVCKKLALIYLHQEKFSKAETLYLQLIENESKDPSIYGNLGLALYSQGKNESAIKAYERAIELEPSKANRYLSLGQIYFDQEELKIALEYFNMAVKKDPKNIEYLFILARAYKIGELYEQSYHTLQQVLQIEPYNEEAKAEVEVLKGHGMGN